MQQKHLLPRRFFAAKWPFCPQTDLARPAKTQNPAPQHKNGKRLERKVSKADTKTLMLDIRRIADALEKDGWPEAPQE